MNDDDERTIQFLTLLGAVVVAESLISEETIQHVFSISTKDIERITKEGIGKIRVKLTQYERNMADVKD